MKDSYTYNIRRRHLPSAYSFPFGRKSKERIISEKYTLSYPPAGSVVGRARVGVSGRERERGSGMGGEREGRSEAKRGAACRGDFLKKIAGETFVNVRFRLTYSRAVHRPREIIPFRSDRFDPRIVSARRKRRADVDVEKVFRLHRKR